MCNINSMNYVVGSLSLYKFQLLRAFFYNKFYYFSNFEISQLFFYFFVAWWEVFFWEKEKFIFWELKKKNKFYVRGGKTLGSFVFVKNINFFMTCKFFSLTLHYGNHFLWNVNSLLVVVSKFLKFFWWEWVSWTFIVDFWS